MSEDYLESKYEYVEPSTLWAPAQLKSEVHKYVSMNDEEQGNLFIEMTRKKLNENIMNKYVEQVKYLGKTVKENAYNEKKRAELILNVVNNIRYLQSIILPANNIEEISSLTESLVKTWEV